MCSNICETNDIGKINEEMSLCNVKLVNSVRTSDPAKTPKEALGLVCMLNVFNFRLCVGVIQVHVVDGS